MDVGCLAKLAKLFWVGRETVSWTSLLLPPTVLTSALKTVHFVNVITWGTILAISAWLPCYDTHTHTQRTARVASLSTKNYRMSEKKLSPSSTKLSYVCQNSVDLKNTSQNTEQFQYTGSWRPALRWKSLRRATAINCGSRKVCKRIYVYLHFINPLQSHIRYTTSCSTFYTCPYYWLLGSRDKAIGLTWVAAQKG